MSETEDPIGEMAKTSTSNGAAIVNTNANEVRLSEYQETADAEIGAVGKQDARRVRIIHISDTHLNHDAFIPSIPDGDILVHSGDFSHLRLSQFFFKEHDCREEIKQIDEFFGKLPHKHKIFVAGNHDQNLNLLSPPEIQFLLKNGIYLQDSSVILNGVKFYGSPWNGWRRKSYARGFAIRYADLGEHWDKIPEDADVVITHSPPFGKVGCHLLKETLVQRVRPAAHLFGHDHGSTGIVTEDGIVFSNAAMKVAKKPYVLDYFVDPANCKSQDDHERVERTEPEPLAGSSGCVVM